MDGFQEKNLKMKFYDAHIHFFYNCPTDEPKHIFEALENIGLAGMDALVISEFPPEIGTVLKMIPGAYHPHVTPNALENQKNPFPILKLADHFNIPHFGFSRKAVSSLLDHYPNCYTDLSSLRTFMEQDSDSYRGFIQRYQDRILFGSDAIVSEVENVQSGLKCLEGFLGNAEILSKLVNENYLTFYHISNGT